MAATRLDSDERRPTIVDAAVPLFARKGFAGPTKRELADWDKAVTPSTELRRWYHATDEGEAAFAEFRTRYLAELDEPEPAAALKSLRARIKAGPVTLLTAAKDPAHSHVAVLLERLR